MNQIITPSLYSIWMGSISNSYMKFTHRCWVELTDTLMTIDIDDIKYHIKAEIEGLD